MVIPKFDELIKWLGIQGCQPLVSNLFIFGSIVIVAVIIYIIIRCFKQGDDLTFSIFWVLKINITPNNQIRDIQKRLDETLEQFEVVERGTEHKDKIMEHLDQVNKYSQRVFELFNKGKNEIEELFHSAVDYILPLIIHAVRDGKPGRCRVAIFVPDKTGTHLRILRGSGYSPDGQKNLRLPMESAAGIAYKEKRTIVINDLTKKDELNIPFYKPPEQKDYLSLACVPIVFFNESIGVLNIDCWEKDAFSSDEKAYLEYFANQMALLVAVYRLQVEDWNGQIDEIASEGEKS